MQNEKKFISIIVPVYNGENTLEQCLASIVKQAYSNYEVIVVDNNSTDKTSKIIKGFQNNQPASRLDGQKVKYVFEKKQTRGAARNSGIKLAKGDIILMTDSDCIVPNVWIEKIIEPIISENETAVMGFEQDLIKNYWTKNIQKANWDFLKDKIFNNYISHIDTKNFAIKSSLIKDIMFDDNLKALEDFDFYLRIKNKTKIRFVPSVNVAHRHSSSFVELAKSSFTRAYWAVKIYYKHKQSKEVKKESMFVTISLKNFITFPFWIIIQFLTKPIGQLFFILISEISWRLGVVWALVK